MPPPPPVQLMVRLSLIVFSGFRPSVCRAPKATTKAFARIGDAAVSPSALCP